MNSGFIRFENQAVKLQKIFNFAVQYLNSLYEF